MNKQQYFLSKQKRNELKLGKVPFFFTAAYLIHISPTAKCLLITELDGQYHAVRTQCLVLLFCLTYLPISNYFALMGEILYMIYLSLWSCCSLHLNYCRVV